MLVRMRIVLRENTRISTPIMDRKIKFNLFENLHKRRHGQCMPNYAAKDDTKWKRVTHNYP